MNWFEFLLVSYVVCYLFFVMAYCIFSDDGHYKKETYLEDEEY